MAQDSDSISSKSQTGPHGSKKRKNKKPQATIVKLPLTPRLPPGPPPSRRMSRRIQGEAPDNTGLNQSPPTKPPPPSPAAASPEPASSTSSNHPLAIEKTPSPPKPPAQPPLMKYQPKHYRWEDEDDEPMLQQTSLHSRSRSPYTIISSRIQLHRGMLRMVAKIGYLHMGRSHIHGRGIYS